MRSADTRDNAEQVLNVSDGSMLSKKGLEKPSEQ